MIYEQKIFTDREGRNIIIHVPTDPKEKTLVTGSSIVNVPHPQNPKVIIHQQQVNFDIKVKGDDANKRLEHALAQFDDLMKPIAEKLVAEVQRQMVRGLLTQGGKMPGG